MPAIEPPSLNDRVRRLELLSKTTTIGSVVTLVVTLLVVAIWFWPSGSGSADDRLLEMTRWTIGTVLTIAIGIAAFGWFQARANAEHDRQLLRDLMEDLASRNGNQLETIRDVTERATETIATATIDTFVAMQTAQLSTTPSRLAGTRYINLMAVGWLAVSRVGGTDAVTRYFEESENAVSKRFDGDTDWQQNLMSQVEHTAFDREQLQRLLDGLRIADLGKSRIAQMTRYALDSGGSALQS